MQGICLKGLRKAAVSLRLWLKPASSFLIFCFAFAAAFAPDMARAGTYSGPGQNWLYTDITGANTTIDADHSNSWLITVAAGQSIPLYGGNFTIKIGGAATDDITLDLYSCAYKCGSPVATVTVSRTIVTGSYTPTSFAFSSPYTMAGGVSGKSYFAILHSNTTTSGTGQYFYKGGGSGYVGDGVTIASGVTVTPNAVGSPQITLTKTSSLSGDVGVGTSFTYTIGLGNSGGAPTTNNPVYVYDQLPAGVSVSAVSAGTGVTSVNCGTLPSSSGALLTCAVTLSAALPSGSGPGTAAFSLTASASTSGTKTNYVLANAAGNNAAPTSATVTGCTSTSCANTAITAVTGTLATTKTCPSSEHLAQVAA